MIMMKNELHGCVLRECERVEAREGAESLILPDCDGVTPDGTWSFGGKQAADSRGRQGGVTPKYSASHWVGGQGLGYYCGPASAGRGPGGAGPISYSA